MNAAPITLCPTTMAHGTEGKWSVHSRLALEEARGRRFTDAPKLKLVKAPRPVAVGSGRFAGKVILSNLTINPRKAGSHGHRSFAIILDNGGEISYEDYRAKGGRSCDLSWDLERQYVHIEDN